MSDVGFWSSSSKLPSIRELGLDHLLNPGLPPLPDTPGILSSRPVKDSERFVNRADHHVSSRLPPLRPHRTVEADSARPSFNTPSNAQVFTNQSPARAGLRAVRSPGLEPSPQTPTLVYSLDVLRLDSSKASLNHLSSSMIFASGVTINKTIGPNINGESSPRPPASTSTTDHRVVCRRERSSPTTTWGYPRSIHSSATRVSFLIDDMNYAVEHPEKHSHVSEEEYKRRKHICPRCLVRFNRPSSLDTHLNSHTGATPFCCPYPNCGRRFSVKSNMLRHHRSHSHAAALGYSNGHKRRYYPPPGFVVAEPINFNQVPIRALSVESSQGTSSPRAMSPLSSEEVASSAPRLHQVFSWASKL